MKVKNEIRNSLREQILAGLQLLKTKIKTGDGVQFGRAYQQWYTPVLNTVRTLAPDRLEEFVEHYAPNPRRKDIDASSYAISDYLRGIEPNKLNFNYFDPVIAVFARIHAQVNILESLETRIDGVLANLEAAIFANIQGAELKAARDLMRMNLRASGALAGVILERHLQQVAVNRQIVVAKKNPTISDLNDPLWKANIYDQPTWRRIQLLADYRNICCHEKGAEPTKDQVVELINGVQLVTSTVL